MKAIPRVVCCWLLIALIFPATQRLSAVCALPLLGHQIAIDPGHGGDDPGACRDGLAEEDVVLDLALRLRNVLTAWGASVRLTRETDADLAEQNPEQSGSRKQRDIYRRVDLVNQWQPDILLSLHVNAIGSSRWRGAQVFFQTGRPASESLARTLQTALTDVLQNTNRQAKPGDYRILNDTQPTAVLLEVGFISNPEEAALLAAPDYRQKIAWAICVGLQEWWNQLEK